jgi:hypothetical protein
MSVSVHVGCRQPNRRLTVVQIHLHENCSGPDSFPRLSGSRNLRHLFRQLRKNRFGYCPTAFYCLLDHL